MLADALKLFLGLLALTIYIATIVVGRRIVHGAPRAAGNDGTRRPLTGRPLAGWPLTARPLAAAPRAAGARRPAGHRRQAIQVARQPLPAAGLAGADDDATTTGLAAVREPVLTTAGSYRERAAHASGRHALGAPAALRDHAAQGSHRAGRSRSAHYPGRPAR